MGYAVGAFAVEIEPLHRTATYLDALGELMTAARPLVDGAGAAAASSGLASGAMSGFSRRLQAALVEVAADVVADRERLVANVRNYAATDEHLARGAVALRPGAATPMPRTPSGAIVDRP